MKSKNIYFNSTGPLVHTATGFSATKRELYLKEIRKPQYDHFDPVPTGYFFHFSVMLPNSLCISASSYYLSAFDVINQSLFF